MHEESKMTRREFLKKARTALIALVAAPSAAYLYARFTEPFWMETKRMTLTLPRLPEAFAGLRVLQFSDLHLGFHFSIERLERLVHHMNKLNADVICFTGDLFDYSVTKREQHSDVLSRLNAPLGKFAVLGNHDYYDNSDKTAAVLAGGGFRVLRNAAVSLNRQQDQLWLAGVEDEWEGKPDAKLALSQAPADACKLLLSHAPDYADIASPLGIDLQLSGHSHGGQVRLPFYGSVATPPPFGRKYVMGLYELANGMQLYTNRGLGMSVHPYRFFCRPELTLFTLEPSRP